jgi:hypothetical protein
VYVKRQVSGRSALSPFPSPFVFAILIFGAMGKHDLEELAMLACACWKRTSIKHLQGIFIYNVTKDRKGKDSFLSSSLTDLFGSANDKALTKMEIH